MIVTCYLDCKAVSKPKPIKPMREAFKPVLTTTLWMDGDLLDDVDRVGVSLWGVWNLPWAAAAAADKGPWATLTARISPPFVMVFGYMQKVHQQYRRLDTFQMFRILSTTLLH